MLNAERHWALPDVPTAIESGLDTTAANALYWWAPKGTSPARVALLADAIEQAMKSEQLQAEMRELSIDPLFRRGKVLEQWVEGRVNTMRAVAFEQDQSLPGFVKYLVGALVLLAGIIWFSEKGSNPLANSAMSAADRSKALRCALILVGFVAVLAWTPVAFAVATAFMVFGVGGTMAGWTQPRAAWLLLLGTVLGCGIEGIFTGLLQLGLP